jgi:hypothetical protein
MRLNDTTEIPGSLTYSTAASNLEGTDHFGSTFFINAVADDFLSFQVYALNTGINMLAQAHITISKGRGYKGVTGVQGVTGPAGAPQGETGLRGLTGIQGDTGAGFTNVLNAVSDGESSTTSSSFQNKVTLSTGSIPSGDYRIGYSAEIRPNSTSSDIVLQVQIDNTTTIAEAKVEGQDTATYYGYSGFYYASLTSGTHTIDLDYRAESAGTTVYIRRARLEMWKI